MAGHSTPTLTARDTHVRLHDLAGAVEKLPSFLPAGEPPAPAATTATGTAGPISDTGSATFAYELLTSAADSDRGFAMSGGGAGPRAPALGG